MFSRFKSNWKHPRKITYKDRLECFLQPEYAAMHAHVIILPPTWLADNVVSFRFWAVSYFLHVFSPFCEIRDSLGFIFLIRCFLMKSVMIVLFLIVNSDLCLAVHPLYRGLYWLEKWQFHTCFFKSVLDLVWCCEVVFFGHQVDDGNDAIIHFPFSCGLLGYSWSAHWFLLRIY